MRILPRLKKSAPENPPQVEWALKTVRLKKLLENARAVISAMDDGAEKLAGEYVLDMHYVTSLVDHVVERMAMMVHDACVLAPAGGRDLYLGLDALRTAAREHFLEAGEPPPASRDGDHSDDPEYVALGRVMAWMAGPSYKGTEPVLDFLKRVVDHVVAGGAFRDFPRAGVWEMEVAAPGAENRVTLLDMDRPAPSGGRSPVSVREVTCPPFGVLVMGVAGSGKEGGDGAAGKAREWFAAVDGEHLSLFSGTGNGREMWLSVSLSGHRPSDFIFILSRSPEELEALLPPGFRAEKSELSAFAWIYGKGSEEIESALLELGSRLFN